MGLSRKLRRGDSLRIGDATITAINGAGMRVQIDAPRHIKVLHTAGKRLTRRPKSRKIRSDK
jgi:sRNA-binding carbon storage regulator CsrA